MTPITRPGRTKSGLQHSPTAVRRRQEVERKGRGRETRGFRCRHDQDRANRVGRRPRTGWKHQLRAVISQGDLHAGRVPCGGEVVGVGPPLSQGIGTDALQVMGEAVEGTEVYAGKAKELLRRLQKLAGGNSPEWTRNQGRRAMLRKVIGYLEPRLEMMRYAEWIKADWVIASGPSPKGRCVALDRRAFDCAGMRWRREKAEALLPLAVH